MSGTRSQSPPLDFPDSSDELEEHNQIPKLDSDDSLDEYLEKSAFEQVVSVVSGAHMHEFVYENPGTDAAVINSGSPKQPLPKVAKKVLTDYEKRELRNRKARERRTKKAAERAAEDGENEGDGDDVSSTRKRGGRSRGTQPKKRRVDSSALSTDEEDDEPLVKFPVCFFIESPKPLAASASRRGASAAPAAPFVITKGPFFHTSDASFSKLQCSIAQHTPCNVDLLAVQSLTWKYDKPANATRVPLTSEMGYETLISSVKKKKGDFMVHVFMKPPSKDVGWPTGDPSQVEEPFDYDEVIAAQIPEGLSRKDQIAAIAQKTAGNQHKLLEKYPIGTHPNYPDKRVYQDGTRAWELTDIRLRVWASSIATGDSDYDKPPTSTHFNHDKQLRPPLQPAVAPLADLPPNQQLFPPVAPPNWGQQYMWPHYQQYPPYPPPYMNHSLPAHGPHPHAPHNPYLPNPYAYVGPTADGPPSAKSSPRASVALKIPLVDFCTRYCISDANQAKLLELEYEPGNTVVETLEEREWKEVKFSVLGWRTFLAAHRKFVKDVKDGAWDTA